MDDDFPGPTDDGPGAIVPRIPSRLPSGYASRHAHDGRAIWCLIDVILVFPMDWCDLVSTQASYALGHETFHEDLNFLMSTMATSTCPVETAPIFHGNHLPFCPS